jgi:hypothetical protein
MKSTSTLERCLKSATGYGRRYWFCRVETLIADDVKPFSDKEQWRVKAGLGIGVANGVWFGRLANEVWATMKGRLSYGADGNIFAAQSLMLILALWYCRVQRAKCFDPKRPYKKWRKNGMLVQREIHKCLLECMTDESMDHIYFPKQEWMSPFLPEKKNRVRSQKTT